MAAWCVLSIVFYRPEDGGGLFSGRARASTYIHYVRYTIYGQGKLAFLIPAIFLGLGGLRRERANHTAVLTLALPVSRNRLVGTRFAVGLAELAVLAMLPGLLTPLLSPFVHQSYPIEEALRFFVVWFAYGTYIFALSFFLSVVMRGDYTAPATCWLVLMLQAAVDSTWQHLRPYGLAPLSDIGGGWDRVAGIGGPLPWFGMTIMILLSAAMFATACRITQTQDS